MMEKEYMQAQMNTNESTLNNNPFMMERLNTDKVLKKIYQFLSGKRKYLVYENGRYREEEKRVSDALANEEGVDKIMNKLSSILNSQLVQGNMKEDHYWFICGEIREDFATELAMNQSEWGIRDNYLDHICNTITNMIEVFLTRLINNKERESYEKIVSSKEVYANDRGKMMAL